MIKLLHFADVHIGMENYGRPDPKTGLSSRVIDFLRRMDEMVEYARENNVDIAIFAGDAFKNRNPNPTFQREFAWRILDLAALCPVILLVGNHDLPINVKKASSIEIYETLKVENVYVGSRYECFEVPTKSGPLQVATAPYPIRARLLEDEDFVSQRNTINDIDTLMQQKLELIIRDLGHQADQYDMPRVLTGHFSVLGALYGSERQIMLGRDIAVTLSNIADPVWDYVALGHIHTFQDLTRNRQNLPPVVYSGSLERIDFSEEGDTKGFVWVELERGNTSYQFIPLKARPFLTLRVDVRRTSTPTEIVLDAIQKHEMSDAVVRVIIQTDPEADHLLNLSAIEQALKARHVSAIASIQRKIEHPIRARLGTTPEGLSPLELLERYFESRDVPRERITHLLTYAEALMNQTD
ncbi:MAG: exonuclease SbcCD subunit D [Phototrophicales bacterium]|nr:MAG: exonuclease SbcCD subunit D [Phototrophicales bacterium]